MALSLIIRLSVAVALTWLALAAGDPGAILGALVRARPGPLVLALGLVVADRLLMAYRWQQLLAPVAVERRPPLTTLLRVFFTSTFLGSFLPASVGSDAVRTFGLMAHRVRGSEALASVLLDRMLGVVGMQIVAVAGAIAARDLVSPALAPWLILLAGAGCAVTAGVVFSPRVLALGLAGARLMPSAAVGGRLRALAEAVQAYAPFRGELLRVLTASIAVQLLRAGQAFLLGLALSIPLGPLPYLAFVPIIALFIMLPVSISGIGTAQAGFVGLFGTVGVSASDAFALSVLFLGLGLAANVPGALLFLAGGLSSGRRAP